MGKKKRISVHHILHKHEQHNYARLIPTQPSHTLPLSAARCLDLRAFPGAFRFLPISFVSLPVSA